MRLRFTVAVHEDEDGSLWAQVEEWPGVFASGRDLDELWEALDEAITLYMADGDVAPEELAKVQEPDEEPLATLDERRRTRRLRRSRPGRVDSLSLVCEA
jgi:predicted RNase H-like HicB family nuclease